jgi:hypothetical protein
MELASGNMASLTWWVLKQSQNTLLYKQTVLATQTTKPRILAG